MTTDTISIIACFIAFIVLLAFIFDFGFKVKNKKLEVGAAVSAIIIELIMITLTVNYISYI